MSRKKGRDLEAAFHRLNPTKLGGEARESEEKKWLPGESKHEKGYSRGEGRNARLKAKGKSRQLNPKRNSCTFYLCDREGKYLK